MEWGYWRGASVPNYDLIRPLPVEEAKSLWPSYNHLFEAAFDAIRTSDGVLVKVRLQGVVNREFRSNYMAKAKDARNPAGFNMTITPSRSKNLNLDIKWEIEVLVVDFEAIVHAHY